MKASDVGTLQALERAHEPLFCSRMLRVQTCLLFLWQEENIESFPASMGHPQLYKIPVAIDPEPERVHILRGSLQTHPRVQHVLSDVSKVVGNWISNVHVSQTETNVIYFHAWPDRVEHIAACLRERFGVTVQDRNGNVVEPAADPRLPVSDATSALPAVPSMPRRRVNLEETNPWDDKLLETGVID